MEQRLRELIERARRGGVAEGHALAKYLRRHLVPPEVLVTLAGDDEEALRLAAAAALRGRTEPEVLALVPALADDPEDGVRLMLAESWRGTPSWNLPDGVVLGMLADPQWEVRVPAAAAAAGHEAFVGRLVELLRDDGRWEVRQTAAGSLADAQDPAVLLPLVEAMAEDEDRDVSAACATSLEAFFVREGGWPAQVGAPAVGLLEKGCERVQALGATRHPLLLAWLRDLTLTQVDPEKLARFGTDLTAEAEAGRLPRAYQVDDVCLRIEEALAGEAPHAVVLVGDSGTGKTAIAHELVHRMRTRADGPWRVLRVSPSEILVDTRYIGEWETKVRDLVATIKSPRRVLLYVPNLHELSQIGRSSKTDHNAASMLAPHLESGDVVLLGESTPEAYRSGFGRTPSLSRLFRRIDLEGKPEGETREIAEAVLAESGVEASGTVVNRLLELADFYLPGTVEPGRAVGLLRRTLERRDGVEAPLETSEVLAALSSTTGVPLDMLDDERPLDLDALREFFESRVRGQPEAVSAVVDLVTLIKAGLTDPSRPYGVFLFVGPTGVGKTELARTLAEFLFGDPARLRRYDMSEYATYDAFERLIGAGRHPGLLTEAVRETPFSVFLLDEIEKAHGNVFDLCLQIFDAGRLTDGQGRTADFRRTIFVLTSNVGSVVPTEDAVGFGASTPPPPDASMTLRELRQFFRPEFLGRIDRIVSLRPLGEETAEWIARREVERVLERSGIARRHLTVDVDPSIVALLLRRGYSPALGARPLKRTVERLVLLPVARAVAGGRVAPGSILRLIARRKDVRVQVEPPDAPASGEAPISDDAAAPPPVRALLGRARDLAHEVERLREASEPLAKRREALLSQSHATNFWDDADVARETLGEIHRWEGVLSALSMLGRRVRDTERHVGEASTRRQRLARLTERLTELESEARRIAFLLACREPRDLADAVLTLTTVKSDAKGLDGVEKLARMYMGFAPRRGLEAEVLDDHRTRDPQEDAITLLLTGPGAAGFLAGESGLHQLVRPLAAPHGAERKSRHARAAVRRVRELIRVEVLPVPEEEKTIPPEALRIRSKPLQGVKGRLLRRPTVEVTLLHVPTMTSLRAWGPGKRQDLVDRLMVLLRARLASDGAVGDDATPLVRRYELGAAPLVRDRRTGRQTGHLDRVLDGDLDLLLLPPGADVEGQEADGLL